MVLGVNALSGHCARPHRRLRKGRSWDEAGITSPNDPPEVRNKKISDWLGKAQDALTKTYNRAVKQSQDLNKARVKELHEIIRKPAGADGSRIEDALRESEANPRISCSASRTSTWRSSRKRRHSREKHVRSSCIRLPVLRSENPSSVDSRRGSEVCSQRRTQDASGSPHRCRRRIRSALRAPSDCS